MNETSSWRRVAFVMVHGSDIRTFLLSLSLEGRRGSAAVVYPRDTNQSGKRLTPLSALVGDDSMSPTGLDHFGERPTNLCLRITPTLAKRGKV